MALSISPEMTAGASGDEVGGQLGAMSTMMGAEQPSLAACWVHQRAPELTSTVLKGKNITDPHFSFITFFRGRVSLNVIQMKKKKNKPWLKTNSQVLLEQLLFIRTRRVPEVSTYTTHMKID